MHAERHLFGSFDGYRTLAKSKGVTQAESDELAEFGFGQTSDSATLESLERRLCVLGRPLRSGRIALTRAFPGPPDDAGRPTLRLCTILLDGGTFLAIRTDLAGFFNDSKLWLPAAFEAGKAASVRSAVSRARLDQEQWHLVDWWLEVQGRRDLLLVLPTASRSEGALLGVVAAAAPPDALQLRWGLHLFSTGASADVCTLAPTASRSMRRQVIDIALDQPWRHPAFEAISKSHQGQEFPQFLTLRASTGSVGTGEEQVSVASRWAGQASVKSRSARPGWFVPTAITAGIIGALLVGAIVTMLLTPPSPVPGKVSEAVASTTPAIDTVRESDKTQESGNSTTPANPPSGKGGDDNANGEGPNDNQGPEEPQVPDDATGETKPDPVESKEPGHPSHQAPSQAAQRPPDDSSSDVVTLPEQETGPPPVVDPRCEYAKEYESSKSSFTSRCSRGVKSFVPWKKPRSHEKRQTPNQKQRSIEDKLIEEINKCKASRTTLVNLTAELEVLDKATFNGKTKVSHKYFALIWSGEDQPSWVQEVAEACTGSGGAAGASTIEKGPFTEALAAYVQKKDIDLDEAIDRLTCVQSGLDIRESKFRMPLATAINEWQGVQKKCRQFGNDVHTAYFRTAPEGENYRTPDLPDEIKTTQFNESWKRKDFEGELKHLTIGVTKPPEKAHKFAEWILGQLRAAKKHLEKTNSQDASEEGAE